MRAIAQQNDPELSEVFAYALRVNDARFWIAFRNADMGDAELKMLIGDVRRRQTLERVEEKPAQAKSGLIGWDEMPDIHQKQGR